MSSKGDPSVLDKYLSYHEAIEKYPFLNEVFDWEKTDFEKLARLLGHGILDKSSRVIYLKEDYLRQFLELRLKIQKHITGPENF